MGSKVFGGPGAAILPATLYSRGSIMGVGAHKEIGKQVKVLGGKRPFVCNAILLPHVERFNLIAKVERFVDIATAMGENVEGLSPRDAADKALEAIKKLSADVGIPSGLKELGVKEKDLKIMAENAQKDACGFTNPRCPTLDDVIQIYKWAL
jgi:alcohol dehydrogenase class IV